MFIKEKIYNMDYYSQRERKRIDKILNKFSCNYNLPVSLAKQSMNKLTRHKRVYSYNIESEKDPITRIKSVKDMFINKAKDDKQDNFEKEVILNQPIQHTFTFQTLRETLAMNPDVREINKNMTNARESKIMNKNIKKKLNKSECSEKPKITYFPRITDPLKNLGGTSSFLKDFSMNRIKNLIRNSIEENSKSRLKDTFITENRTRNNIYEFEDENEVNCKYKLDYCKLKESNTDINEYPINNYKKTRSYSKTRDPDILKKYYRDNTDYLISKPNSISLSKALKLSYFSENKKKTIRRCIEDESSLKGWDKITPIDMLET